MWLAWLLGGIGVYVFMMSKSEAGESSAPSSDKRPTKWDADFKKYAAENGIDWRMLKTIAMNESSLGTNARVVAGINNPFNIKASTSTDGKSWGIMQLTVPTARDFDKAADEVKLNDPVYSIKIAAKFLGSLSRQFNGKIRDVVMAYNHGAGNQKRFVELEKTKTLKPTEFPAGRAYYDKYIRNYQLIFG